MLGALRDVAGQKAQREAVQEIGQAQLYLQKSAQEVEGSASIAAIKRLQARAVGLAAQASRLQISQKIRPEAATAVPQIKPWLDLVAQAEALRSAILGDAEKVREADPAHDAGLVRGLIESLEKNIAALRAVTRDADRELDELRAVYLSSASLVVSGGASLGSYQAGFLQYYTQYLSAHGRTLRPIFGGDSGSLLDLLGGFKLVTGASAGSINAFLAAVAGCRKPVADPEQSLFYRAWIPVGMDTLIDSDQVKVDGILSRKPIQQIAAAISQLWTDRNERAGWEACDAYLGISATRLRGRRLKFPERVADKVADGAPSVGMTRLTEKFTLRMTGPAGAPPSFSAFRPNPRDPKATPPAELYPTLGADGPPQTDNLEGLPAKLDDVMGLLQASSSFPFAFPPVPLPITVWSERPAAPAPAPPVAGPTASPTAATASINSTASPPQNQPVFVGAPEPNAMLIDGGVFDNTPLGLAIRMSEWMPQAPARFLFLSSGNVAWQPSPPPPLPSAVDSKPKYPGTTFDAYLPFVSDFVSASEDTELMNTVEGHGDIDRELPARQMPVAGEQLGHFLAFFERDFRIFDFYMGMVDAHDHIASHNPEQLKMLLDLHAGPALEVHSTPYTCFLARRGQLDADLGHDPVALPEACRGVDANLLALLAASTKIKRLAQARLQASDSLQEFFDALDESGYHFRALTYRGSPATGATAKRAIRDQLQALAHDLSSKQDGLGNRFVVSLGSKAAPNLFLYRPPRFYLAVGLDTDAGAELEQGFELGQLPFSSSRPALRLTLSERVREFDRSRLDPAGEKYTYAATFMGAAHLVLELPISNVFQLELGAGAAILDRIGWVHDPLLWRFGPEGLLRLDILQRFFLGAGFVYYLDDCAGDNRCSQVTARFRSLPGPITSASYKIWVSVGTRFFWFN